MVARPRKWYEVAEKVVDSVEEERKAEMTPAQSALLDKYRHLLRRGFRGAYVHGLDTKGRMIVPASFRQALGDRFYICMTPDFKAIAIYPQHGVTGELLSERADQAMYQVKKRSKSAALVYF